MNKEEMEKVFNWIRTHHAEAKPQERLAHVEMITAAYYYETMLPNPRSLDELIEQYEKERQKNG